MSDLISREELIEKLEEHIEYADYDYYHEEPFINLSWEMVEDIVGTVPSVPQWIPCSERLPTEKEAWDYNAEDDLYEPNEFIVQVKRAKLPTVAMFDGETFTHGYAEDGYGFMDEIIAWMPLPEPYKGE